MRVAVAICSVNRPEVLAQGLRWLRRQTLPPSEVLLVVSNPTDLPAPERMPDDLPLRVAYASKGLTRQRNRAIELLQHRCDVVFFMDDDFIPANFAVEGAARVFRRYAHVSGLTGTVLADGVGIGGLSPVMAEALIAQAERRGMARTDHIRSRKGRGLYGCNMALRMRAVGRCRFDESLPLYGWQEDVDFANRLPGMKVSSSAVAGVHLGTIRGRETHGRALGYSQIANVVFLIRKGTMSPGHGLGLMGRNLASNTVRSLCPEPWVDRRARLRGNCAALADLMRLRLKPENVLEVATR